jgi:O-antigen ligase
MEQLRSIVKPLFLITAVALVLAVPEAITHQKPIIEYTSKMTGVSPGFYSDGTDVRLGLRRAQAFFENPILFGLFCATCISLVWYNEERLKTRLTKIIVIAAATFISLSSAPLLAMTSQVLMLTIERITRRLNNRILILSALSLTILLGLNAFTKSGPFGLIINYLTFNQASSYNRVLIWDYGLQNISDHPFFGIVPEDWYRAPWMKVSIDNFWIYTGLLSGFVGWALIASAIILIMWRFGQVPLKNLSVKHIGFRRGWAIAMIAFVLTGFSVMFFGKLQPYFYFMVGIGAAGARIYAADSAQKTKQIMDQKRARVREQMDRLADARRTVAVHP